MGPRDDATDWERGYLAGRYLLGSRGPELSQGLLALSGETRRWLAGLRSEDRTVRARTLAAELGHLIVMLDRCSAIPKGLS